VPGVRQVVKEITHLFLEQVLQHLPPLVVV